MAKHYFANGEPGYIFCPETSNWENVSNIEEDNGMTEECWGCDNPITPVRAHKVTLDGQRYMYGDEAHEDD